MPSHKQSVEMHNDPSASEIDRGRVIRDAWVFGIVPESESCDGWTIQALVQLEHKVNEVWKKYDFKAANLPPHIRTHFDRIYGAEAQRGDR